MRPGGGEKFVRPVAASIVVWRSPGGKRSATENSPYHGAPQAEIDRRRSEPSTSGISVPSRHRLNKST